MDEQHKHHFLTLTEKELLVEILLELKEIKEKLAKSKNSLEGISAIGGFQKND